jgi:SAM-dependent methyltransferase
MIELYSMAFEFDYQSKVWGTVVPSESPFNLAGLRFFYFLRAIASSYGSLLEVGCGAGGNLSGVRKLRPYLDLYGVDISNAAIEFGKKRFPHLHLETSTAENLPFENSSFNIVCFFDVLEHVAEPFVCLKEANRVLVNKGVLHAYIPVEGQFLTLHGLLNSLGINLKEKTAGHIQKLTKSEVIRMCNDSGFELKECVWSCHYINQVGDLLYYLYLTLTGTKLTSSLEETLSDKKGNMLFTVLSLLKKGTSFVWYWESRILWFFPGAGIHLTCVKKSEA